jgi:hypothetical protein
MQAEQSADADIKATPIFLACCSTHAFLVKDAIPKVA